MPFRVRLQEFTGEIVDEINDNCEPDHGRLTAALARLFARDTAVLQFLDPHGDTMLNGLQMSALIRELEDRLHLLHDDGDRAAAQRLTDLAARGAHDRPNPPHRQLWFIGD